MIIHTPHSLHSLHSAQAWDLAKNLPAMQGWSYPAFCALFAYMEEITMGEQEADPRAWAYGYSYWKSAEACCKECHADQYADLIAKLAEDDDSDEDSLEQACLDYLSHHTTVIYSNGSDGSDGIIVEDF